MNAAVPNRSVLVLRVTYNGVAPSYCDDACATNIMYVKTLAVPRGQLEPAPLAGVL
jgi:hypothetical protein